LPELDFVIGPGRIPDLPQAINDRRVGKRLALTGFPTETRYDFDSVSRSESHKGMVTVIEGCDKKCTFCIVPQTRDAGAWHILDEVRYPSSSPSRWSFSARRSIIGTVTGRGLFRPARSGRASMAALASVATSFPRDFTDAMIARLPSTGTFLYLRPPGSPARNCLPVRMGGVRHPQECLSPGWIIRRARLMSRAGTDLIPGFPWRPRRTSRDAGVHEVRFANVFAFPTPHA
jgi:tRNA-2-methylthio-N6-dimethylallyladenosine synthase